MRLILRDSLLFVTVTLQYRGVSTKVTDVLLDTGSASTIFATDALAPLGLRPEPRDVLRRIRGVGGAEHVFSRVIDRIAIGERGLAPFEIEVGGMDYGFEMNGILGLDFRQPAGAILDLHDRTIRFP
jgi:hypothetical protein